MKRILTYLKEYRKECVIAPLFKMLEALFELFVPLVVSSIIDIGIGNQDKTYIVKMCLLLIALAVIGLSCSITAQYYAAKAAVGCSTSLRHHLFTHIQQLSFTEMDTIGTSTLITRMTSDVNQVQNGVNLVLRLFLRSPFIVFGAMIMAFMINVRAALVFVAAIPVLALIVFTIMFSTRPLYKKVQAGLDQILGITRENLTGVRVIRAFSKEKQEIQHFQSANEELNQKQKFVGKISALMNPATYIVVNVSIIVLIWIGAIRVNSGTLTQGQVVALYNYMSQILVELIKLANLIISVTKALACANRIDSVFQIQSSMPNTGNGSSDRHQSKEKEKNLEFEPKTAESGVTESGTAKSGTAESGIAELGTAESVEIEPVAAECKVEFDHVSLKYKGSKEEALTDLNFKVQAGQTIGIIGGTGSGKSSLVNMIPRFYDATNGTVWVDHQNIKNLDLATMRNKVGMVMQKALLFKGTIRENLLWGKEDASEEEMWNALDVAQATEFVKKKQDGLDSFVDQGGKNLSGGQKQRLTIARAVLRKPEILILDDSASALDLATDAALRKSLQQMEGKMTVFIVSQRAASIMHADQIIVLDDGMIAGIGTHEQLLKTCEVYQEIYYSQFRKEA